MAGDPNECRDQGDVYTAFAPELHRSIQKFQRMFGQWIWRESGYSCPLSLASLAFTFGAFSQGPAPTRNFRLAR
jgi:hypothetical protein